MIPYPPSSSLTLSGLVREAAFKSHKPGSGTSTAVNKKLLNMFFVEFNPLFDTVLCARECSRCIREQTDEITILME